MWAGGRDYQAEEAEDERIASGQWVERVPPYISKLNQKQHPTKSKHLKLKYSRWMFLPDPSGKVRIMGRSDILPTIKEDTLELKEIMEEVDRIEDKVKTKILDLSESLEELEEIKEEVERLEKEIKDKDERKFNNSGIIDISTDLSDEEDEAPREIYLVKESMKRVLLNKTKTSFGLCISDSGCEKECAGVQWTEEFIANLSKEDQNKVEKVYDGQKFRFSGRQVMTSLYSVKVPFYIGGIWFYMAWSVMDLDLPLLMSLPVMQRLNITVKYSRKKDKINDRARVMGKNIRLHQIDGHQWMALDYQGSLKDIIQEQQSLPDPEVDAQEVLLLSGQQMYTILKDCGKWSQTTEAVVEEVLRECENLGCRKKGNIVKNLAANFNMVNAPGYCAASLIQDKSAESAAQGVWNA